jgi:hypothetical protein
MSLQKKMMMISWGLPPGLNGSSNIVANLAQQFSPNELVVAGERWPGPKSSEWSDENGSKPEMIFVHRQWPWRFKRVVRLLLFPVIFTRLAIAYRRHGCRQVMAIFPDEFYLFAGYLLSIITGDSFFSYFHNTYAENRSGLRGWFSRWLQPRVFRRSKIVYVMSDGMKEHWERLHPGIRFEPLVHTFNEAISDRPSRGTIPAAFQMAFMGNANKSNFDALSRLPAVLEAFPDCRITTYSGAGDAVFARLGLQSDRVRHTRVGYDQVVDELSKFDLLFLAHGFVGDLSEVEYATIFPTRTIPYLLSGTPIVAHSPPNAFLTRWLRSRDCAEIVDEPQGEALVQAVSRLIADPRRAGQLVHNALCAVQHFQAKTVAAALREKLNHAA